MDIVPDQQSDLARRGNWIAACGWLICLLSAGAAFLPMFERRGGAMVIGGLLIVAGMIEVFAGSLRHETRKLAMLSGAITVAAGLLFFTGPATRFFLPAVAIILVWLAVRATILFVCSRLVHGGVKRWTLISALTDVVLALLLVVGLQIASFVVSIFGATAPLVASFAWVMALTFIVNGMLLLEVANCAKASEDV